MNEISDRCVVAFAYVLESKDGTVYDNRSNAPIHYLHGCNNLVPGLEKALEGHKPGDEFTIELSSDESYGPRKDDILTVYPLAMFDDTLPLKVGEPVFVDTAEGKTLSGWVTTIDEDSFTVNDNHPLAGQDVVFKVRIIAIRPATPTELADGCAHTKQKQQ